MIYNKRLIELRESKDLKQYDIANILCYNFKVSFDYLFEFTKQPNYEQEKREIDIVTSAMRLKELRKEKKLTQEKLAKELNMARSALANYERGRTIIATPFLYTICKNYHISADYLLGKIDEKINLK